MDFQNLSSQVNSIYNHLGDDVSKKHFSDRLMFSLTNDRKFINSIIANTYHMSFEEYKERFVKFFADLGNEIFVYGTGTGGSTFLEMADGRVKINAFCDSNPDKIGKTFNGYQIISPTDLAEQHGGATVVLATYSDGYISEMREILCELAFDKEHILSFEDIPGLQQLFSKYKEQYFDAEVIMPRLSKKEVFIDVGCYDCYSTLNFIERCGGEYERILAFEPDPGQYALCKKTAGSIESMEVYPFGLWDENTELCFNTAGIAGRVTESNEGNVKIITKKLDDILELGNATYIKVDIEGAELNALKGAKQTIEKYRPKLAISVYHKSEDILEIPLYILSLYEGYTFFIRHYTINEYETVLYAI